MKKKLLVFSGILSAVLALPTGCGSDGREQRLSVPDTAAVVFGPSLTELFFESGASHRLAAVDSYSTWPPEAAELPRAGDYMSPSLEAIAAAGATSIHVVGHSNSLRALAEEMGIPLHVYSFDTLDDLMETAATLEELYPEANLQAYREDLRHTLESTSESVEGGLRVMMVIYFQEDGAITLAGDDTFFGDIIRELGCTVSAPETGSYPAVSVEGVLSLAPDRVIILAPEGDSLAMVEAWSANGLSTRGVTVLTGEQLLVPGSRLSTTIREMGSCLN